MEPRHLLLMILDACGKKIDSKTKLHKMAYFASIILKRDFQFVAYFYGPYSRPIDEGLGELTGAGFVHVNINSLGMDEEKGFEKKRYDYSMTQDGITLVNHLKEKYKTEYSQISQTVESIKEQNYYDLSIAAKAYFILNNENHSLTVEEIRTLAENFTWNIKASEISTATRILENLQLIEKNPKDK